MHFMAVNLMTLDLDYTVHSDQSGLTTGQKIINEDISISVISMISNHATKVPGGNWLVRRVWVIFQCRGVLLDYSMARAYCACSGCGRVLFGHFSLAYRFSLDGPI